MFDPRPVHLDPVGIRRPRHPHGEGRALDVLPAVLDRELVPAWLLRLQVEREGAVLVVVELAVGRLPLGSHAVQAKLPWAGLAGVDETANVLPERALAETLARAEHLGGGRVVRGGGVLSADGQRAAFHQAPAPGHAQLERWEIVFHY